MDPEKLAKVLAMVDSDHHGEAVSALRAARAMLARAGLTFRDLAGSVRNGGLALEPPAYDPPPYEPPPYEPPPPGSGTAQGAASGPDPRIKELERQIQELEAEVRLLYRVVDRKQRLADRTRDEAERWRQLARDTAEQLWDLGRALEQHYDHRPIPDKHQQIIEHLCDPHRSRWSDREIARRVGAAPQVVALWRRRLFKALPKHLVRRKPSRGGG